MARLAVNYYSQVLGMDRMMQVILPELSDHMPAWTAADLQDIPVLYLLHGMSGDQDVWSRRTSIERLVRQTPIAIVMPSTDLAWYTNTTYGMAYLDALLDELPKKVATLFPQISQKREKNFVAGLSMGGYGAFKMAFSNDQFSHVHVNVSKPKINNARQHHGNHKLNVLSHASKGQWHQMMRHLRVCKRETTKRVRISCKKSRN